MSWRRRRRLNLLPLEWAGHTADAAQRQHEERLEDTDTVFRCVQRLSGKKRAVVVLRYYWDLAYAEIATILDIPLGTVKSRLNEALRVMRDELAPHSFEREPENDTIRLNKFIANSGICSRREADDLITGGLISVNGKVITELRTKINLSDMVRYNNEIVKNERLVYLLLNKPKDFITTMDDPEQRHTVMQLVASACKERIYPVGRLDRNTTGLLLFTNDGEMAKKLTHPSSEIRKVYHVELDKNLSRQDMELISKGVELEDGIAEVDDIAYDGAGTIPLSVRCLLLPSRRFPNSP